MKKIQQIKSNDLILSMRAAGESYRFIHERTGLNYRTIKRIETGKTVKQSSEKKAQNFYNDISKSHRKSDKVLKSVINININKLSELKTKRKKESFVKKSIKEKSSAKVLAKEYEKTFSKKALKKWKKENKYSPYVQFLRDYYENLLKGIKLSVK